MAKEKTEKEGPSKTREGSAGFSDIEKEAMAERAAELKAAARGGKNKADTEAEVLAKIADMAEEDQAIAKRLHELVKANFPELTPKTWYGMPSYFKDGKSIVFFQSASRFKTRYCTLGFNEAAKLDEGHMWPTAYAMTAMTDTEEKRILALIKQALS